MPVTIQDVGIGEKLVLYRVDYNVPLLKGIVVDDFRLRATIPTLDFLLHERARVIILSHLGRPGGRYDPALSLRPVAQHLLTFFKRVQIQVTDGILGPTIAQSVTSMPAGSVLMLGNTRFFPGEEAGDFDFARQIAQLGEVYVTDAFGVMHRRDATVVQLPKLLDVYPGLLIEQELKELTRLRNFPQHPFTALIGGAKLKDKVELVRQLLRRADYILVGGAVANTFAAAAGQEMGASLVDEAELSTAKEILAKAKNRLILPVDFVRDGNGERAPAKDIGPQSIELFKQYIAGSREIFWNGTFGVTEESRFAAGSSAIAQTLATAKGLVTVAGGDTVAFVEQQRLTDQYNFVSTGGGAATSFVAGQTLPGLAAINVYS